MNADKLQQAENTFLASHPGGFLSPEMAAIGKKHKMAAMIAFAQEHFKKSRFSDHPTIAGNMVKLVSRSSMVSMFEKPKFRDFVNGLSEKDTRRLSIGLKNFLHGDQEKGFDAMLDILLQGKLAKWSLMTIIPNYYHPDDEVFVKPTTAKGVIAYFELEPLVYKPQPSWAFYQAYRRQILAMKATVDETLAPSNAAFCGFLMMNMNA